MSPPNIPEENSPDYLAAPSRKGKGVRRLNFVPLLVVGVIVAVVVGVVTYTFFQRQAENARRAVAQEDDLSSPAVSAVHPLPPTPPVAPAAPVASLPASAPAPVVTTPDPELVERRRLLRRIGEAKYSAAESAMGAEARVSSFSNRQGAAAPTGGRAAVTPHDGDALASLGSFQQNRIDALQAAVSGNRAAGGGGFGGSETGGNVGGGDVDLNQQDHKRAFLAQTPEIATYLQHTRTQPLSSMEIKAGTVIPGVMISGINSDLPGQIIGQVRENVFDTASGRYLLIPAGARLVGSYDSTITMGQERVLVAWRRIIYPDGSSVSLDHMPGADQAGYAGFTDQINNHYAKIFGNALLLSAFSAGVQLSQPKSSGPFQNSNSQTIAASLGQQLGQVGMQMVSRNMSIQPTLEIRPGYRFLVQVTKDIVLPPWKGHPLAQVQGDDNEQ